VPNGPTATTLLAGSRRAHPGDAEPSPRDVPLQLLAVGGDVHDTTGELETATGHRRRRQGRSPAMTITRSSTYDLASLVTDLDLAVRSTRDNDLETVEAVCSALRPALSLSDLLLPEQRMGDPAGYRSHVLHVAPNGAFSLVALVWLPGQATAIHDHLSWCVVGVYEGAEHETRFRRTPSGPLVEAGSSVAYPGDVAALLPPGDIHRVHNASDATAISLHVYGADLRLVGSSIRRAYPTELVTTWVPPR
jgi:predicted metal-dependent enzyme (double-stranded beta helix superfamily)